MGDNSIDIATGDVNLGGISVIDYKDLTECALLCVALSHHEGKAERDQILERVAIVSTKCIKECFEKVCR